MERLSWYCQPEPRRKVVLLLHIEGIGSAAGQGKEDGTRKLSRGGRVIYVTIRLKVGVVCRLAVTWCTASSAASDMIERRQCTLESLAVDPTDRPV